MTEAPGRLSHRLSVVWFTDLVGYSPLAARDHDRALALVERFQRVVGRIVPAAEGRVVKFVGDAALLESPSARAAVDGAIGLHGEMGETVRTGIHLGDVAVAPDGDLYGDGVNGAQRIQAAAEPGWILLSEDVWRRLRNRPAYVFESVGERSLKGIEPMDLYRLVSARAGETTALEPASMASSVITGDDIRRPTPSIAVLPFTNMSPRADDEYFSDGVTEEILTLLARIEGLKVISRTSVMQYKGTLKPVRQIAHELGVGTILEGSVRYAGQRVRITAQLIDAVSDRHLWAERYDRDLEDIFAIQSDVAERIVEALRVRLTSRERSRLAEKPTENVEAYQWYLKARHFLSRRTGPALRLAIDQFRKAVAADPGFAQAWVGLADGLILLPRYTPGLSSTFVEEATIEARAAAEKALFLDPRSREGHVSLGLIASTEWKWDEAERHYRLALEISPGYATGLHWYALLLWVKGRGDEAVSYLTRALELDPLSLPIHMALGAALTGIGRHEEALDVYGKAIELDPAYATTYNYRSFIHMKLGKYEEALADLEALSRLDPERLSPETMEEMRRGYASGGERGFWEAQLETSPIDEPGTWAYGDMAEACARLGRKDEAFEYLNRLVAARGPLLPGLLRDLEPLLRDDPRFEELERRIGLA